VPREPQPLTEADFDLVRETGALFVAGIPDSASAEQIQEYFSTHGGEKSNIYVYFYIHMNILLFGSNFLLLFCLFVCFALI
jgi:hypothetical protein